MLNELIFIGMKKVRITESDINLMVEDSLRVIMEKLFPYEEKPMSKELEAKRLRSNHEVERIENDAQMEKLYNEIMTNGYFIVPMGKSCTLLSGGRRKFYDSDKKRTVIEFSNFLMRRHPDKQITTVLIPRKKKLRGQLDDTLYFDVKVMFA